jgi:hypothetical protein
MAHLGSLVRHGKEPEIGRRRDDPCDGARNVTFVSFVEA